MPRLCFILALLVGACASHETPEPYWIPYDGYGPGAAVIGSPYTSSVNANEPRRDRFDPNLDVRDIGPALDQFLSANGDKLILLPNRLDKPKLDFSLESLMIMDEWLKDVHTINRLQADTGHAGEALISDGRGDNSIMFAGLYLGEVIRANSDLPWRWERFDRFIAANP
ncbi:MAG: hypothetical protein RLN72_05230 [Henriciella sp.]